MSLHCSSFVARFQFRQMCVFCVLLYLLLFYIGPPSSPLRCALKKLHNDALGRLRANTSLQSDIMKFLFELIGSDLTGAPVPVSFGVAAAREIRTHIREQQDARHVFEALLQVINVHDRGAGACANHIFRFQLATSTTSCTHVAAQTEPATVLDVKVPSEVGDAELDLIECLKHTFRDGKVTMTAEVACARGGAGCSAQQDVRQVPTLGCPMLAIHLNRSLSDAFFPSSASRVCKTDRLSFIVGFPIFLYSVCTFIRSVNRLHDDGTSTEVKAATPVRVPKTLPTEINIGDGTVIRLCGSQGEPYAHISSVVRVGQAASHGYFISKGESSQRVCSGSLGLLRSDRGAVNGVFMDEDYVGFEDDFRKLSHLRAPIGGDVVTEQDVMLFFALVCLARSLVRASFNSIVVS